MGADDNLPRELDSRASGGIEVCLWWSPADDRTWVCVDDVRSGAVFVLPVADGNRARERPGRLGGVDPPGARSTE